MEKLKRISFDLEQFKTWLEDMTIHHDVIRRISRWDDIRDRFEVDEEVGLLGISEWVIDKKVIISETEVLLVGITM